MESRRGKGDGCAINCSAQGKRNGGDLTPKLQALSICLMRGKWAVPWLPVEDRQSNGWASLTA